MLLTKIKNQLHKDFSIKMKPVENITYIFFLISKKVTFGAIK